MSVLMFFAAEFASAARVAGLRTCIAFLARAFMNVCWFFIREKSWSANWCRARTKVRACMPSRCCCPLRMYLALGWLPDACMSSIVTGT